MNKKPDKKSSLAREMLEVIFAFVFAYAAYQGLAYVTGTPLPIVAVVSDSMYHAHEFDSWWQERSNFYEKMGVDREEFSGFPMRNGLSRGDLLIVLNSKPVIGDIVIYEKPEQGISIVHRVIDEKDDTYIIKGDNNAVADQPVSKDRVVGKVVFAIPLLGYPRFLLFAFGV